MPEAPLLDLHLSILDGFIRCKIFDKRDDFDFEIVNFPSLVGDISSQASWLSSLIVVSSLYSFDCYVLGNVALMSQEPFTRTEQMSCVYHEGERCGHLISI